MGVGRSQLIASTYGSLSQDGVRRIDISQGNFCFDMNQSDRAEACQKIKLNENSKVSSLASVFEAVDRFIQLRSISFNCQRIASLQETFPGPEIPNVVSFVRPAFA